LNDVLAASQSVVVAWETVIVAVPAERIAARVPDTLITFAPDDEYVKAPRLSEVGLGRSKSASRNAFETSAGAVRVGAPFRTVTTKLSVAAT
jgi:hypothetical protein